MSEEWQNESVTKGAAIDALRVAYWDKNIQSAKGDPCIVDAMTDWAIRQIKVLPSARPEQRWIPVTERLPERGKDVLVTRDYDGRADHIKSCRYVEVASCYGEDDDVSWNSYSDEYKMTPKNHRVVAWMPLPKAYKGEKE